VLVGVVVSQNSGAKCGKRVFSVVIYLFTLQMASSNVTTPERGRNMCHCAFLTGCAGWVEQVPTMSTSMIGLNGRRLTDDAGVSTESEVLEVVAGAADALLNGI
jgi:hypothetical protein